MRSHISFPDRYIHLQICDFLAGRCSPAKTDKLGRWLNKDKRNGKFFRNQRDLWLATAFLTRKECFNTGKAWQKVEKQLSFHTRMAINNPYKLILT